jgi:hypothetical protein
MSIETVAEVLTSAELAEITCSGQWVRQEPSPESDYKKFRQFIVDQENDFVRSIMNRPFVGWIHRVFKTSIYRRFVLLPKE